MTAPTTITFTLNGEPREAPPGITLAELIASTGVAPEALATAIDGEFVPRAARTQRLLRSGDAVFTFQPITGG
jgi:sulfur carrier protein